MARIEYPYNEGDLYWTLEIDRSSGDLCAVQSVWDDVSEEIFDAEGSEIYFDDLAEILDYVAVTGLGYQVKVYPCTGRITPYTQELPL